MDDFTESYRRVLLERDYPAPEPAKGSRLRAQETAPSIAQGGMALMDMLAGALKGATAQTMGLPGDVESLIRLLAGGQQVLPTTEDFEAKLPPVVPDADPQRAITADRAQALGAWLPLPVAPVRGAKAIARAVK